MHRSQLSLLVGEAHEDIMVNDTIAKNENEDVPKKKIEQGLDVPESGRSVL